MTAVDHAELKRVDMKPEDVLAVLRADRLPECSFDSGRTWEVDGVIVAETFTRSADLIDTLLSEIEGLKAERDADLQAMAIAARNLQSQREELSALRTQAPDSWRPDREAVAKLIYEAMKWAAEHAGNDNIPSWADRGNSLAQEEARLSTDAILALRPQTAESGK